MKFEIDLKLRRSKERIVISVIVAVIIIVAAVVLYVNLYKIPHDNAVSYFNNSVEQFNVAKAELENRNKKLDDSIASLSQVVYAEDIPVDDFLLLEANSVLEEARSITRDSAPPIPAMPKKTDEINAEASEILEMVSEVQAMGEYSDILELLSVTEEKYQTMIDQFMMMKMNEFMAALQTHLAIQQPTYPNNAQSILEVLFDAYNESSGFDNTAIKSDFEELYRLMNGKPLKEIDEIIYAVCTLCRDHEKAGFVEGVMVGMSLTKEVNKS